MPFKKLKMEEGSSTEELIAAIESKDRRFRLFQALFMVGTFTLLTFIIGAQQQTLARVEQQLVQSKENARAATEQNEDQQAKIIRRLNCMVVFFSETNRSSLTIDNIDKCTLNRDEDIEQFFEQPESTPSEQPPNLPDSSPAEPSENEGEQAILPEPPVVEQPTDTPPDVEPRPPVALETPIIDIPLCVPLTEICVR